ncbi:hypothetical protein IID24_02790 [Patescibacteria group bacterium]|nr:hypothetical protein [Patescibacteria group bacterium]
MDERKDFTVTEILEVIDKHTKCILPSGSPIPGTIALDICNLVREEIKSLTKKNKELRTIVDCPDIFKANETIKKLEDELKDIKEANESYWLKCTHMKQKNKALMELLDDDLIKLSEQPHWETNDNEQKTIHQGLRKIIKALQGEK